VKLLRVLQEGEVKRVGADETRTVDVRVLAATNVDLATKIQAGEFRRDLYYRLNVIAIELPPLRERGQDVVLLANHFLQKLARSMQREPRRLAPDAVRAICEYGWPGNVRELEHAMEHAMVLGQHDVITAGDLPFARQPATLREISTLPGAGPGRALPVLGESIDPARAVLGDLAELPYTEAKRRLVAMFDDAYTADALRRSGGNMSEAARLAGLDRSNFRRLKRRKDEP
jgi:DNA-binding NtrC family response regulator